MLSSLPRLPIARLLSTAALCALLAACGDSNRPPVAAITNPAPAAGAEPAPTQAPAPRVALIMKTLTNPFFVDMEHGARQAEKEIAVDLRVKTATQETSIEQQIQLVEQEIQAQAKAIVIAPGDSTRLVPVLKKAQDAGIHIVNLDNRLNAQAMAAIGMQAVPFISVNNEAGAYQAAKFIADQISQPTDAAIIEGIRSANNAQQRKSGAVRAFEENKNLRIVASETANWKIDEAYEVAQRLFKQHPHIGLVFCSNDMMAIGVLKYLQESGKSKVLVAGFDALEEAKTAIRIGQLSATVDQQAAQQGYRGMMAALQLLQGGSPPLELEVEAKLVTADSLK
ncbi:MAG: substrate-binding domain-containing protein [Giesbergeria sp.]|nr:substrate-binding domain-containing protein [Giesbergeria sp.]